MPMLNRLFLSLILLLSLPISLTARADTERLVIYAEDSLPFAYISEGKVRGPTSDFVRLIAQRAGYEPEIRLASWSGIINRTETEKSVIFYPMARTPEREDRYQWIGSIAWYKNYNFYKKKGRKEVFIHTLDDAKKYKVGIIINDVRETYLLKNGFKELKSGDAAGLVRLVNNIEGMRLLKMERIDLLPLSLPYFESYCKGDCVDYEAAMPLDLSLDLELAATKGVAPETIERLRNAFQSLQKDGTYTKLLGNH